MSYLSADILLNVKIVKTIKQINNNNNNNNNKTEVQPNKQTVLFPIFFFFLPKKRERIVPGTACVILSFKAVCYRPFCRCPILVFWGNNQVRLLAVETCESVCLASQAYCDEKLPLILIVRRPSYTRTTERYFSLGCCDREGSVIVSLNITC